MKKKQAQVKGSEPTCTVPISPKEFREMDKETRLQNAQENMRSALDHLGQGEKQIRKSFDLDDKKFNERTCSDNWTKKEVDTVLSQLPEEDKLKLFTPKGFECE